MSLVLYDCEGSGNCFKVRILLSFLGLSYDSKFPAIHPADSELLQVNPLGQVPVLVLGDGRPIVDSAAILIYLAVSNSREDLYPLSDAFRIAEIQKWLSYASHEVSDSLLWVRVSNKFEWEIPVSYEEALKRSRAVLDFLNSTLSDSGSNKWLVDGENPTLADISVFPYVALCESSSSGVLTLADYPSLAAWIERVKGIENFPSMPPF